MENRVFMNVDTNAVFIRSKLENESYSTVHYTLFRHSVISRASTIVNGSWMRARLKKKSNGAGEKSNGAGEKSNGLGRKIVYKTGVGAHASAAPLQSSPWWHAVGALTKAPRNEWHEKQARHLLPWSEKFSVRWMSAEPIWKCFVKGSLS